jgi:hypothetical protein
MIKGDDRDESVLFRATHISIPSLGVTFQHQGDTPTLSVPSDAEADGMMTLPSGIIDENVQQVLAQFFALALATHVGHGILIRLSDEEQSIAGARGGKKVTYWLQ